MKALFALVLLGSFLMWGNLQKQENDADKLQGTWILAAVEIDGMEIPLEMVKEARLTIQGNQYSFVFMETRLEINFQVNTGKSPKTIDLEVVEGPEKGKLFRGIYSIEGDQYRICRPIRVENARPLEFNTFPQSGLIMVTWKREKLE